MLGYGRGGGQAGQHVESMTTGMYARAGKHAGNVQEGTAYKLSEAQPSKGHPALCSAVLSQQHAVVRCDMPCCATIWMAVRTLTRLHMWGIVLCQAVLCRVANHSRV